MANSAAVLADAGLWRDAQATIEGWLNKKGGSGWKTYKKRWCKLVDKYLFYFKDQNVKSNKPLGVIDLTCTKVVEDLGHKNSFCLTGPNLPRTYFLTAETPEDKDRWWQNLTDCINKINPENRKAGMTNGKVELPAKSTLVLDNRKGADGQEEVGLQDFELLTVIGRGSFGKVMKVRMKRSGQIYAMKVLRKDLVIKENMIEHTKAEKNILQTIDHPFIVTLRYAFQTDDKLYLILDFLPGGELFFHLQNMNKFSEVQAKQYAAEIVLALEHLHSVDIVYRDLKPENCVLDAEGFVVLTDFGLAKQSIAQQPTYTFCGTPEYLAPEILKGKGHAKAVDWWSLGVLLYEMLFGLPPFYSENVNEMYEFILKKRLDFPPNTDTATRDLLSRLLERDENKRLKDGKEVRAHPFFVDTNWDKLYRREVKPVFRPDLSGNDTKNFDAEFTREKAVISICHALPGQDAGKAGEAFKDFAYAGKKEAPEE
eukprot:TRINITY_DN67679_c2_g1_i1.p1 TRINITY_DN67679_c2_g1~~TRINITY_DN67679_c2_g1_i1.p1  ORF type:complete len:483 (-),score=54.70 TRINITY_DN67679_c2_g1_i1:114-1562(-)